MDVSIDRNPEVQLTLAVPQPDSKHTKPGDDIALSLEKPVVPSPVPKKPVAPSLPPPPPPPPPPSVQNEFRQTFEEFANPKKLTKQPVQNDDLSDFDGGDLGSLPEDDNPSEYSVDEPPEPDEEPEYMKPSPGFHSLDEEKASLIFKLARAKRAGMPSTRNFTMASDIRDLRGEMARIDHELALDASLKFQRKMMLMTVSVMEHMNTRFDPFDLQLSGWSESVHSSISDYDRVFERLHEKYKSKVSVAPEIELLFMVGGSAMMFHFTKTVFKQGLPGMPANPELMASMMKAFTQSQPQPPKKPDQPTPSPPAQQQQPGNQKEQRREMRGPAMDLGGILGGLGNGGAMPFPPMDPPQIANPTPKSQKTVSFAPGTKRPAPEEDTEERFSDIVSDVGSLSESLSSFGSESSDDGDIRTVQVKKGGKKGPAKKVMKI
jgi:hypothetical protein